MRVMGLDYGDKTVGVAISDELLLTAQPVETIGRERSSKLRKTYQRIEALIEEYGVEKRREEAGDGAGGVDVHAGF